MRRNSSLALVLASVLLAAQAPAFAQTAPAAAPAAKVVISAGLTNASSPESVGFDSARLKKLDDYMAKVVADGRVAGMTTLLARHGKIVEFKTYGKASLDTGK